MKQTNKKNLTAIYLTQAIVGDGTLARLQVETHRIPKTKRGKCNQCKHRLLFFWKKRNCHMCGEVVCGECRRLVVIECQLIAPRKHAPNVVAKVCFSCVDAHFSKPATPNQPKSTKKPTNRSATKVWLQNIVSSKEPPARQSFRRSRNSVHRTSIHRPVRKHAFDSPRARRTSRHSQRLFMPPKVKKWTNPWAPPPVLPDENERMKSLRRLRILDTPNEEVCDIICTLASTTYNCSIAGVTFMDKDRQWFKASTGLKQNEIPRKVSLCAHAMTSVSDPMIILDTDADERFKKNPLVTGLAQFKFYMSVPFATPLGHVLGTIFVADTKPRRRADPKELQKMALAVLHFVMSRPTDDDDDDEADDVAAAQLADMRICVDV